MEIYYILLAIFAAAVVVRGNRTLLQPGRALTLALLMVPSGAFAQVSFAGTQFPVGDAALLSPGGIAMDHLGNLYIADSGNNRVLELPASANGFAASITILGNLSKPTGITVDWSGNLYIADSGNNRILKLAVVSGGFASPSTIASGLNAPGGIGLDAAGNLFVAETGNNRVVELPALASSYGAPIAIGSGLNAPAAVAVDASRNLYVADTGNNRIVKMTAASAYTTQQALFGNLIAPTGVFVDAAYDVFIASAGSHKVVKEPWAAAANRFNNPVVLGNGWASPTGVVPDASGNIFVVDSTGTQLWEIPAVTQSFPAIAVGAAGPSQIYNFSVAAGTTIGSTAVLTQGASDLDFNMGSSTSCTSQTYAVATICSVQVQFNPTGSGLRTGAVVFYDSQGNSLVTAYLSGTGIGPATAFLPAAQIALGTQLSGPSGVAVDGAGNIYVADTGNNRIVEFPFANGDYGSEITLPVTQLDTPMGLAIDGAGNLFIASSGNDKIVKLPRTGTGFATQIKLPIATYVPTALNFDGNGTLYVADTYENSILKIVWNGNSYATPKNPGNYVKMPMGVAVDKAGDIFFTMPYQNNLVEVPYLSGKYQPQRNLATQQVTYPTSIVTDGNSNLYLLDSGNNRVVMYPATASGFGAQITVASGFNAPMGMAIDGNNTLYIADSGNNRIVILPLSQAAPIRFVSTYVGMTSQDSARYAMVQNIGNVPTTITSLAYPGDFPEDLGTANSCIPGIVLTPGTGCPLALDFSPQATGALSETASVVVSHSAVEQTTAVSLSGTALSRQSQTITFAPIANMTYGSPSIRLQASSSSGLPVSFQVVSGPATLAANGVSLNITGVGTVIVTASQSGNAIYQPASSVTISFSIAPATLTVTPANATATYGSIPSGFGYSISGFVVGQSAGQVVSGAPVITVSDGPTAGVGTHAIVANRGTLQAANYVFAFAPGMLTVTPATLQIVAQSTSMTYGAALPKFTWTAKGFVNGESVGVLHGSPEFGTPASSRAAVGSYAITPTAGTLKAANYTFSFTSGTLTITAAALTVTANSESMVYGSALPQMSYSITGFLNGDTASSALSGSPAFATAASQHAATGIYVIKPSAGTLKAANYSFVFVNGSMTIVPAPLTVTPTTVTMTYGQSIPALKNLQLTGLVNGDTAATALTGAPILSTSANAGAAAGTAVIAIQKGTLAAANYTIQLRPGRLIINAAVLKITPASVSRVYGSANPAFSYTITGFVNGETASQLSGSPSITTSATPSSSAGSYAITASPGTLNSANYIFTSGSATLTVTKAPLTFTVKPLTITYGAPTPAFTYAITGLVNGDAASVITGTPVMATTAGSAPAAGSYPISINVSGLTATSYSFTGGAGTLTVNKAAATVTANNQSVTVGSGLPSLTYTVSGLVNNDQATVLTGAPNLTTTAAKNSPVGTYPIAIAMGTVAAKNYSLTLVNGTLTIAQSASNGVNPQPITPRLPNKHLP